MDDLSLLLIFCIVVIILCGLGIAGIFIFLNVSKKSDQKSEELVEKFASRDTEILVGFMRYLNIRIPTRYQNENNSRYLSSCIRDVQKYAYNNIKECYPSNYKCQEMGNIFILYDSTNVVIPSNFLCSYSNSYLHANGTNTGIKYTSFELNSKITIEEFINIIQRFNSKEFLSANINVVKWNDLIWYLDGVPDSCYLATVAAHATLSGILLGPLGALGGIFYGDKKVKEEERSARFNCRIIFGYRNGPRWVVCQDMDSDRFRKQLEFLVQTCPNIKGQDIKYKKR